MTNTNCELPCRLLDGTQQQAATALERVSDAFFAVDGDWRFTYLNARAAALLRQPVHRLLGRRLRTEFPGTAGLVFEHECGRAMAQQVAVDFEVRCEPLDLWIEVRAYPGADGLSVCLRDIAGRKRAQAALRRREQELAALERTLRDSEERFRALSASSPVGIFQSDLQGRLTYVNPRLQAIWDETEAEMLGAGWLARVHPEDRGRLLEGWHAALASCAEYEADYRLLLPDGTVRCVRAQSAPLRNAAGAAVGSVGTVWDITERQQMERALAESGQRLRLALSAGRMVAWEHDLATGLVQEHAGSTSFPDAQRPSTALPACPPSGKDLPERRVFRNADFLASVHLEDRPRVEEACRRTYAGKGEFNEEFRIQRQGETRWLQVMGRPVPGTSGGVERVVGVSLDITERKALEAELVRQAYHDALTQLENRTRFRDRVQGALARQEACGAPGSPAPVVLFVDLDDFKDINDSLGHAAGDWLLVLVAERLRQSIRDGDTVARLGGDEFAILLEQVPSMEEARAVAARIVASIARPFQVGGRNIHASASVGIARAQPHDTPEDLLRNADLAMYRAKHSGKGRHQTFAPEMHSAALERLTLVDELHRALGERQFHLHYQPIVEMETGRILGAEALARWSHPERGPISPGTFIPLAEESGLILPLGRWVLGEACRNAVRWPRTHGRVLAVTVNVSARQLQEPAFVTEVREALEDSGLPPGSLVLEITESVLMRDRESTLVRLQELKALGVRIAVDDFGTGFSSLAYLQRFPVDVLKIDKSFVDTVSEGVKAAALTRTIIGLADSLGLRCVAEGVEHEAQRVQLLKLGCRHAQGYLFARPMTADALQELFAQRAREAVGAPGGPAGE